MEKNVSKEVKRIIICCIASCIIAVNIRTFVRTGGLFPGGANGLTLLIQSIFDRYLHITIPYTAINVLLNAVPVYIGFRFIGKKFTLYSCLVIFLTGFLTDCLPSYTITSDILLISIFGGLINGFAISLCLKYCEGAHEHSERKIVYSVVSRDENNSVIRAVREADPQAFINSMPTNELEGHFYQRPID